MTILELIDFDVISGGTIVRHRAGDLKRVVIIPSDSKDPMAEVIIAREMALFDLKGDSFALDTSVNGVSVPQWYWSSPDACSP